MGITKPLKGHGKSKIPVSVAMDNDLLYEIELRCRQLRMSRSEYVNTLVKRDLDYSRTGVNKYGPNKN